jgi:hypothetical protein
MSARKKRPKSKLLHITPARYRELRESLGFTPASAAYFFGVDARTERRWSGEPAGPPAPVIVCFLLLFALNLNASAAGELIAASRQAEQRRRR